MAYPLSTSIHLVFDNDYNISINDQIKRIINCGFKYLDFNFLDWQTDPRSPFLQDGWEKWVESAGNTANNYGAVFNQAHSPCPCYNYSNDYERLLAICKKAIKGCSIIGVNWMVFHVVPLPRDFGSNKSIYEFNQQFFSELLDDCHKYNVGMALENIWPVMQRWEHSRIERLIELADSFNDELVGICWDTGHGNLTGNCHNYNEHNTPELLKYANQYENIMKIGNRLKCLHINDNNGMDDDHITPFLGTINWSDVIRALDDIDYQHSFTFEAHHCTSRMPEECKDDSIRLLHKIGTTLVGMSRKCI